MEIQFKKPENSREYRQLVEMYSGLADEALRLIEERVASGDLLGSVSATPAAISIVNVVGYLRGQDSIFLYLRPDGVTEFQKELYKNEDAFEARLSSLIGTICDIPEGKTMLKERVGEYYLKHRGLSE